MKDYIAKVRNIPYICKYTFQTKPMIDPNDLADLRKSLSDLRKEIDELKLALQGVCPGCGRKTKEWKAPSGSFAPEFADALRRQGIDIATGHKKGCKYNRR